MSAFTRIALVALSGMAGRMLRKRKHTASMSAKKDRSRTPTPAPWAASAPSEPDALSALPDTPTITTEETSPSDPFRNLTYRRAPRVASIAARGLSIIGLLSTLLTIVVAIGTVIGELPGIGLVQDTNLAWAAALVTISIWAIYLLWRVAVAGKRLGPPRRCRSARTVRDRE